MLFLATYMDVRLDYSPSRAVMVRSVSGHSRTILLITLPGDMLRRKASCLWGSYHGFEYLVHRVRIRNATIISLSHVDEDGTVVPLRGWIQVPGHTRRQLAELSYISGRIAPVSEPV
jgi:hypothetical protein